ncbi:MAG: hypothetical protein V2J24_14760 [Pseudomonadales bacterium]|jgi:hypothetical protein|nr:hypothetical protein [Pseudomonadales bacterium]
MSTLTVAILVLMGGGGVGMLYMALGRGLKFRDDFVEARRPKDD